jgi:hypothetical protein
MMANRKCYPLGYRAYFFLLIAMANDDKPSTSEILQSNITRGTFIEDITVW